MMKVNRLSFDDLTRLGVRRISSRDEPLVIDMPAPLDQGIPLDRIKSLLGDKTVALFRKSRDPNSTSRSHVTKIRLADFFDDKVYNGTNGSDWFRIVGNLCNRPDIITELLGRDVRNLFPYHRLGNSANIWLNYKGQFGRSHFDELENFNLQLVGQKRFVLLEPGFWNYYTRSVLQGFGHHSRVADFDNADLNLFPRLRKVVSSRREILLEPGQMLYLPLGWWHQVHPLSSMNVNINFWLKSLKILTRPYVFIDSMYKTLFRRVAGLYDYQPDKKNL